MIKNVHPLQAMKIVSRVSCTKITQNIMYLQQQLSEEKYVSSAVSVPQPG